MSAPTASSLPDFPGYDVQGELGRGGMGVVYRAFDRRRGEVVALKTLPHADPAALYRFKQEFRGLADVSHVNLASLYELHAEDGRWFFTMEMVEGEHFLDHVRSRPERLREAFRGLAEGIAALHAAGKIHRDVKPTNVLVARDGRVVLLDFGLAADVAGGGLHQSTERHVLGTAAYMSPEQALGRPVSAASDWYSFGVILFEALTGRLPFEGNPVEVLLEKQRAEWTTGSLGTDAPADLAALAVDLLRRDPAERPSGQQVIARLGAAAAAAAVRGPADAAPPRRTTLVGRERHLEVLEDCLDAARKGRTTALLVRGRSGIGKTALVQHFLDGACAAANAAVFAGRCYERESVPYKAFDAVVDAIARHLGRLPRGDAAAVLPRDVGSLVRAFPVFGRVEAVVRAPDRGVEVADPVEARRRAFAALRELLARLGDRRPVVVHVDDLQWGDADSAELLASLLRPPDAPSMLFVGCYRSEDGERSPFLAALSAERERSGAWSEELAVEPLSRREARDLALALLGGHARATALSEEIARESAGNPLFVQELAEHERAEDAPDATRPDGSTLTLDEVLWARISRLPSEQRTIVETVAVSGRPLPVAGAIRAAGLAPEARSAIAALRAARLLRTGVAGRDDVVDTYHDRIRESVLARMAPGDVAARHREIAVALEVAGSADPEVLAAHFLGAGDHVRARALLLEAGDAATRALAADHAVLLYRAALDLPEEDPVARRALRKAFADALVAARRGAEAAPIYLAAADGAPAREQFLLRRNAAEQHLVSGDIDAWNAEVGPLLATTGFRLPATRLGTVVAAVWAIVRLRLRGLDFVERDASAVAPDELERLDTSWALTVGLGTIDNARACVAFRQELRVALDVGEPSRIVRLLCINAASTESVVATRGMTGELVSHATAIAESMDDPSLAAFVHSARSTTCFVSGAWRSGWQAATDADALYVARCTGCEWETNVARFYGLRSLEQLGDLATLRVRLAAWLEDADQRKNLHAATNLRARLAHLPSLADDAPAAAHEEVDRAMRRWTSKEFTLAHCLAMFSRVDTDLYADAPDAADRRLREGEPEVRRVLLWQIQITRAFVTYGKVRAAVGRAARLTGSVRRREIARASREASRLFRERMAYTSAWGTLVRGCIANVEGRPDVAVQRFAEAETLLAAADMALCAAAARRRRGELLGGDEGRALVESADAAMTTLGVKNPGGWTRMYAPGFER